jgi:hypothetical protein
MSRFLPTRPLVILLAVLGVTLPAMVSLFQTSGYWDSHDGVFHLYRLVALESAWRQGYLYPRIFPEFAFGYGFAVLNFYGPLTYYVALIGRLMGMTPILAMKATYALSYPLAAMGMWALAREVWRKGDKPNEWAGVISATVYTYVPYHLADVQLRGALAESWAFVWWGWLLWAAWRGRFFAFMGALAGLVLTHNLSVVLIAVPLAVWCLMALRNAIDKRRYLIGMTAATLGAAALSAFYWLPVLLESRYIMISQDVGGLGFARHLQPLSQWIAATADYRYFPNQGVAGEHPLSWAQLALLGLALIAGVGTFRSHKPIWLFGWLTLLLSLFLLSPFSFPLWERLVFPFGLIQYPWRWLGITALASALVAGGAVVALPPRLARWGYGGMGVLLLWLAWSGLANLPYTERAVGLARYPVSMWEEDAANGQVGATWTAEFLPLAVKEQRWALARAPEHLAGVGERTPIEIIGAGGDEFTFWVETTANDAALISVPRFAYPSMMAEGGQSGSAKVAVEPRGLLGIASFPIEPEWNTIRFYEYPLANHRNLELILGMLPVGILGFLAFRKGWRGVLIGGMAGILLGVTVFMTRAPVYYGEPASGIAKLGEQAQLVAWKTPIAHTGNPLSVSLMWFNLEQTDQNYVTYIHLTAPDGGAPLAQHDSQPNMGTIPTTRWLAGQLVEDLHLVDLPPNLTPGTYQLWAGMYAVQEGQAVPISGDSGERRLLGEVAVQ